MKIVRPTINILTDKIAALENAEQRLRDCVTDWTKYQNHRDEGYIVDQWTIQYSRGKLERAIVEYRKSLADVYDFMGDKGLV